MAARHQGLLRQNAAALARHGQVSSAAAGGGRPDQPASRTAFRLPDEPRRSWLQRARPHPQGPGVFASSLDGALAATYSRGSVIESDFANGDADQYRVIVDTNSSILDRDAIANIAEWVKRGGTFITFEQTGRHTSTQHDAWPISALPAMTSQPSSARAAICSLRLGKRFCRTMRCACCRTIGACR